MPTFAIFFHGQPDMTDPAEQQAAFEEYMAWATTNNVISHPFKGEPHMEGPTEAPTGLSGYGVFEATDAIAAQSIAAACPHAKYRAVEVVEIMTMG